MTQELNWIRRNAYEQGNAEKNLLSSQIDLSKFELATEEEKRQQEVMSESSTFFKDGMKRLRKNPLAMASIVVLIFIIALILVAPHIVPYSYSDIITVNGIRDKTAKNLAPFTYSKNEQAYIERGGKVFPHILERMKCAVIILSVWFMGPEFPLVSDSLPVF